MYGQMSQRGALVWFHAHYRRTGMANRTSRTVGICTNTTRITNYITCVAKTFIYGIEETFENLVFVRRSNWAKKGEKWRGKNHMK